MYHNPYQSHENCSNDDLYSTPICGKSLIKNEVEYNENDQDDQDRGYSAPLNNKEEDYDSFHPQP